MREGSTIMKEIKEFLKRNYISVVLLLFSAVLFTLIFITVSIFFPPGNGENSPEKNEVVGSGRKVSDVTSGYPHTYKISDIKSWMYGGVKPPEKLVFITVDDGPSLNNTPRMLDILKKNNIRATFFYVTAGDFKDRGDIARRTWNESHSIGLHSDCHNYSLLYPGGHADTAFIISDLNKCLHKIEAEIPGFSTNIMRFPGGSFSWDGTDETISVLRENNMFHVDWNIMTGDADNSGRDKSPEGIVKYIDSIYNTLPQKDVLILLMHDPSYMDITPDALQNVIDYFRDKGYSFGVII